MARPDSEAAARAIAEALEVALASPESEADFERFQERLFAEDDTVRRGPFVGMRLVAENAWSQLSYYLLGSYERELHTALEHLISRGYDTVADVGCAEGYYAVGLARRIPSATVYAFDVDEGAQRICRRMADANDVADRVVVEGACEPRRLEELLTPRTLVFVDCEGCEAHLLDPSLVPGLVGVDMVVELHDHIDPEISGLVLDRFRATHDIEIVIATERSAEDYPELAGESGSVRFTALWEGRPLDPHPMQWAILLARRPPGRSARASQRARARILSRARGGGRSA